MFEQFTQDENAEFIQFQHLQRVSAELGDNKSDDELWEMIKEAGAETFEEPRDGSSKPKRVKNATHITFEDWKRLLAKTKLY